MKKEIIENKIEKDKAVKNEATKSKMIKNETVKSKVAKNEIAKNETIEKKQNKIINRKKITGKTYFYQKNRFNFIMTILTLVGLSVSNIATAFILQNLIDISVKGTEGDLISIIIVIIAITGGLLFILWMKKIFLNQFMKKAMSQYKNYIFGKILSKNIDSFHKESTGTYLSAFSNDLGSIEQNYLSGNFSLIFQIILFISGLISIAYLNWVILLCTIIVSMLPLLVSFLFGNRLTLKEKKVAEENASFLSLVKDLLTGFPVIKSFRADKEINSIFQTKNIELESYKKERKDLNSIIEIYMNLSGQILEITVVAVGVYFAIKGKITPGTVVAFIQLLNFVLGPIEQIGSLSANKKAANSLLIRLEEYAKNSSTRETGTAVREFSKEIVYKDVSFGYEKEHTILNHINLRFEKGKSYAIVGGSGSGKSTLLNLLLGYHEEYEGKIEIDGLELREINIDSLYDLVSIIQQNVFVFDKSIEENITLFKNFEHDLIEYSTECAGLKQLIDKKGKEYKCGENGCNLSGGEKQRISIARSLIRKNPILLMDEATAALDNQTAHQVEEAILAIKDTTKLIVTHKMDETLLKKYDEIIVMNQGSIVEQGTFDELNQKRGYFASLYKVLITEAS